MPSARASVSVAGDVATQVMSSWRRPRAGSRYATVVPVPSPTTIPSSTNWAAASAATRFSRSMPRSWLFTAPPSRAHTPDGDHLATTTASFAARSHNFPANSIRWLMTLGQGQGRQHPIACPGCPRLSQALISCPRAEEASGSGPHDQNRPPARRAGACFRGVRGSERESRPELSWGFELPARCRTRPRRRDRPGCAHHLPGSPGHGPIDLSTRAPLARLAERRGGIDRRTRHRAFRRHGLVVRGPVRCRVRGQDARSDHCGRTSGQCSSSRTHGHHQGPGGQRPYPALVGSPGALAGLRPPARVDRSARPKNVFLERYGAVFLPSIGPPSRSGVRRSKRSGSSRSQCSKVRRDACRIIGSSVTRGGSHSRRSPHRSTCGREPRTTRDRRRIEIFCYVTSPMLGSPSSPARVTSRCYSTRPPPFWRTSRRADATPHPL